MSDNIVFSTKWFDIEEDNSLDAKNPYYRINTSDSVCIIPITKSGEIVLVNQFRPAIRASTLEMPAGSIEKGETPLEAARRELMEETGMHAKEWHILSSGRIMMDRYNARIYGFLATGVEAISQKKELEHTVCTLVSFKKLVSNGRYEQLAGLGFLKIAEWKYGTLLNEHIRE